MNGNRISFCPLLILPLIVLVSSCSVVCVLYGRVMAVVFAFLFMITVLCCVHEAVSRDYCHSLFSLVLLPSLFMLSLGSRFRFPVYSSPTVKCVAYPAFCGFMHHARHRIATHECVSCDELISRRCYRRNQSNFFFPSTPAPAPAGSIWTLRS